MIEEERNPNSETPTRLSFLSRCIYGMASLAATFGLQLPKVASAYAPKCLQLCQGVFNGDCYLPDFDPIITIDEPCGDLNFYAFSDPNTAGTLLGYITNEQQTIVGGCMVYDTSFCGFQTC